MKHSTLQDQREGKVYFTIMNVLDGSQASTLPASEVAAFNLIWKAAFGSEKRPG